MSKLTQEQKQEIIDCNINHAKIILEEARLTNKGVYSHSINKMVHELSYLLSKKDKYNYDDENNIFWKIVKIKHSLAGYLFYLSKGV